MKALALMERIGMVQMNRSKKRSRHVVAEDVVDSVLDESLQN